MKDYMAEWKRNSIRIGAPTCIMAAFTAFIPVLYLCSRYGCWPKLETVLAAWALTALSFGAFYIVEPISYYAALGMSGTYLGFLSGNIGNMRVPCAALALDVTDSKSGTIQAEVVREMKKLREQYNAAIILVTHNMGVASYISDKIGVMCQGKMVEFGKRDDVIFHPQHEYTRSLLAAVPRLEGKRFAR